MSRRRPWWRPRRSRRSQRWALAIVLLLVGWAAWSAHGAWRALVEYPEQPLPALAAPVEVEIPRGTSLRGVLDLLVEHGVLTPEDATAFRLFVLHKGAAGRVTAGPHRFTPSMTPGDLLEELTRRPPAQEIRVTIPEGLNLLGVAKALSDAGLGEAGAFEAAMRDAALVAKLGLPGPTLEGYLFPDTYKFPARATPEEILTRMVQRHKMVYTQLKRRYRKSAEELARTVGFGDHQIVTLASIVEKETGAAHERPIIAGVFLNRLRFTSFQPKLLQTDPTIIYGCTVPAQVSAACKSFQGRIRRVHLRDAQNPYNTYQHEGLPPGPIANPGRAALEAVFAPKKTRFLFFVARNDGTHQFSKSRAEHEKWVDLYMRKGKVGDGSASGSKE